MIRVLTNGSVRLVERYLPDPFVLAALLTLVVFAAGMLFEGQSPIAMAQYWQDGFWSLLTFAMQMVLVLTTGYVLAKTPFVGRLLERLAALAKTPGQAILLVSTVSLVATWINWGLGLVVGALFARQLARVVQKVDYRLLIASAYSGFLIWHGGFSGSIPLLIATPGHFLEDQMGLIATGDTIFSTYNLAITIALLLAIPLINWLMNGHGGKPVHIRREDLDRDERTSAAASADPVGPRTPAERLETSWILSLAVAGLGLLALAVYFISAGFALNLNVVNFLFLFLGILLHGNLRNFLRTVNDAVRSAGGIVIQFPFYAGIMGMMAASGLAASLTEMFVSISTAATLPLFSFLSAGLVNILIPSGGGQWAVQGPIMIDAAHDLGVDTGRVAMSIAWGDSWTNMIQPFWALPALAIAGLRAKDIMGFCVVVMLLTGIIIGGGLVLF